MENAKKNANKSYGSIAKLLHWGFVVLFVYGISKQLDEINELEDIALLKFEVVFALAFLILLIIRFIYMKVTQNSSLPEKTPEIQKLAAKIVHYAMYICLAAIAGTGLIIGFLYWMGFKSGFLINSVVELHSLSVSAIYWFIAIHILAAIYHRLLKDGVWTSMVPFLTEKNK